MIKSDRKHLGRAAHNCGWQILKFSLVTDLILGWSKVVWPGLLIFDRFCHDQALGWRLPASWPWLAAWPQSLSPKFTLAVNWQKYLQGLAWTITRDLALETVRFFPSYSFYTLMSPPRCQRHSPHSLLFPAFSCSAPPGMTTGVHMFSSTAALWGFSAPSSSLMSPLLESCTNDTSKGKRKQCHTCWHCGGQIWLFV